MRLVNADPLEKTINELKEKFTGEAKEALSLALDEVINAPTAEIVSGEYAAIRFKERGK